MPWHPFVLMALNFFVMVPHGCPAPLPALQADSLMFVLSILLCCGLLSASPVAVRHQMHLWLLSAVARAPLLLQPLLLLCQPARRMYMRCRWAMGREPRMLGPPSAWQHPGASPCCCCIGLRSMYPPCTEPTPH